MNLTNFSEDTKRLSDWFGKRLTNPQLDIMFDRLKNIPGEAYRDIADAYIEDLKPTPGNFPSPKDVLSKFWIWKTNHPGKTVGHEKTLCLDCQGKGFLWTSEFHEALGRNYTYCYRCGSCTNWQGQVHPSVMPELHRSIAERDGIKVTFPKHRSKCEDDLRPRKFEREDINSNQIGS